MPTTRQLPASDSSLPTTKDLAQHFVAAMWALKHNKHICVQKPLCNTIWEVRELHRAAKAAGVVTQMGNQGRTSEGHRQAKEWIEQGVIGTLKEVRLWTNRPIWPQGPMSKKTVACPPDLNWDLWLTSEPEEPYFEFVIPEGQSGQTKKAGKAGKAGRRGNAVHPSIGAAGGSSARARSGTWAATSWTLPSTCWASACRRKSKSPVRR